MPISEKKKEYLFSKHHEKRFKSVLQNRSLAISFWSDRNFKSSVIKKTDNIKIKKRIRICKPLLPKHCDDKLVEQALSFLQIYPEDSELLKNLGDYIKNDLFERIGYWGALVGTIGSGCVFYAAIVISPLVLHPYLGVFSICMIATSTTFFLLNIFYDHALGLKLGRWMGEWIEGTPREPANLKELEKKLVMHIQGEEIQASVEEVAQEAMRMPPYEDNREETQEDYSLAYQCLDRFWATGSTRQETEMNSFPEYQRITLAV